MMMGKTLMEKAMETISVDNEYDRDDKDGMIVFNVDSPTKKDPDRVLTYQLDVQFLGDDYI